MSNSSRACKLKPSNLFADSTQMYNVCNEFSTPIEKDSTQIYNVCNEFSTPIEKSSETSISCGPLPPLPLSQLSSLGKSA
jgi:hypothetical protein